MLVSPWPSTHSHRSRSPFPTGAAQYSKARGALAVFPLLQPRTSAQLIGEPNTRRVPQKNLTKGKSLQQRPPERVASDELSAGPFSAASSGSVADQHVIRRALTHPKAPAKIKARKRAEVPPVLLYPDILICAATFQDMGVGSHFPLNRDNTSGGSCITSRAVVGGRADCIGR